MPEASIHEYRKSTRWERYIDGASAVARNSVLYTKPEALTKKRRAQCPFQLIVAPAGPRHSPACLGIGLRLLALL